MSNELTFSGKTALDANKDKIIRSLPAKAQTFAFAVSSAVAEFENYARAVSAEATAKRSSAAREIAIQGARFKESYDIKKDKDAEYKTWGEFAENVLGIASSTFSRLSSTGKAFYLSSDETAMALCDMYPAFTLAELLPMRKEESETEWAKVVAAVESGELSADMTEQEVKAWVQENREAKERVEKLVDIIYHIADADGNRATKRVNAVLFSKVEKGVFASDFKDEATGIYDTLPDGRKVEWKHRVCSYAVLNDGELKFGVVDCLYHAHKTPKTGKDGKPVGNVDKWDILRQSMERCGIPAAAIDALIEAEKAKGEEQ